MYILETDYIPSQSQTGVFKGKGNGYWEAWIESEGTVYDLGRFGSFVDAGAAYLKVKLLLEAGAED